MVRKLTTLANPEEIGYVFLFSPVILIGELSGGSRFGKGIVFEELLKNRFWSGLLIVDGDIGDIELLLQLLFIEAFKLPKGPNKFLNFEKYGGIDFLLTDLIFLKFDVFFVANNDSEL